MRIPITISALAALLWLTGATYYVDPRSTGGDGTTPDTTGANAAWTNPMDVTGIVPGDSVLFCRGQIFRQPARSTGGTADSQFIFTTSGTAANPIVLGAYGTGNKPILSGAINGTEEGIAWNVSSSGTNEYYATISGGDPSFGYPDPYALWAWSGDDMIRLAWTEDNAGALADSEWTWADNDTLGFNTMYMRCDAGIPSTDVEIARFAAQAQGILQLSYADHLIVEDLVVQGSNIRHYSVDVDCDTINTYGAYVIGVDSTTIQRCKFRHNSYTGIRFQTNEYVTLDSCEVYDNEGDGIGANNIIGGLGAQNPFTGWVVSRNLIHDNFLGRGQYRRSGASCTITSTASGSGMKTFSIENAWIHHNKVYDNSHGGIRLDGGHRNPAQSGYGTLNSLIEYNEVYGNGATSAGGIYLEVSAQNMVRYNTCYGNNAHQIAISLADLDGYAGHDSVMSNIVRDDGASGIGIVVMYGADNAFIANNTVDNCYQGIHINGNGVANDTTYGQCDGATWGTVVRNNLVTNSGWYAFGVTSDLTGYAPCPTVGTCCEEDSTSWENNQAWNCANWARVHGTGNYDLAGWRARGHEVYGLEGWPAYADSSANDFRLTVSSPGINKGAAVLPAGWKDFDGNTVTGLPDIGAFEYQYAPAGTTETSGLYKVFLRFLSRGRTPAY